MNHDPMCRRAKIMELLMEGCPECDLIARVREDERGKTRGEYLALAAKDSLEVRAAALRDAIAAVESREDGEYFPWPQVEIAIAAIQDLQP